MILTDPGTVMLRTVRVATVTATAHAVGLNRNKTAAGVTAAGEIIALKMVIGFAINVKGKISGVVSIVFSVARSGLRCAALFLRTPALMALIRSLCTQAIFSLYPYPDPYLNVTPLPHPRYYTPFPLFATSMEFHGFFFFKTKRV